MTTWEYSTVFMGTISLNSYPLSISGTFWPNFCDTSELTIICNHPPLSLPPSIRSLVLVTLLTTSLPTLTMRVRSVVPMAPSLTQITVAGVSSASQLWLKVHIITWSSVTQVHLYENDWKEKIYTLSGKIKYIIIVNNKWMNKWKATKVHVHAQCFSISFPAWEDRLTEVWHHSWKQ